MRLIFDYLRQHRRLLAAAALCCAIFLLCFRLYHLPLTAVLYPGLLCAVVCLLLAVGDFLRLRRRHRQLTAIRSLTDALSGIFPPPGSIESRDYQHIIRLLGEEQQHARTQAMARYDDMVDYYTVWAHQIKTPLASMRLHLQNEDSPLSRTLSADLNRVEQYVEMVLTFLRLDADSTDYVIREYALDPIIRQTVKRFSHEFIGRRLTLDYQPVNTTVLTDEKWLSFVIGQLLSNALKYTRSGSISITLLPGKRLCIRDTGIGIAPEDLPRIFENGYTGYNGRADKSASGIGLYLCRRVCDALGHGLRAESVVDVGTTMILDLARERLPVE